MAQALGDRTDPGLRDGGFILLEMLVAIAVIGLVLSTVGSVVAVTFAAVRSASDRVALTAAAQTLLDSLPEGDDLVAGTTTGVLGGTLWRVDVVPLPAPALAALVSGPGTGPGWTPASIAITARTRSGRRVALSTIRLMRRFAP